MTNSISITDMGGKFMRTLAKLKPDSVYEDGTCRDCWQKLMRDQDGNLYLNMGGGNRAKMGGIGNICITEGKELTIPVGYGEAEIWAHDCLPPEQAEEVCRILYRGKVVYNKIWEQIDGTPGKAGYSHECLLEDDKGEYVLMSATLTYPFWGEWVSWTKYDKDGLPGEWANAYKLPEEKLCRLVMQQGVDSDIYRAVFRNELNGVA